MAVHFLVVAYPVQSHINPCLRLAKAFTALAVRVTFSTAISAHRRMFSSSLPLDDPEDPLLSYHPYSDGYDQGYTVGKDDIEGYRSSFRFVGSETLHAVATTPGRPPVTCIIHALLMPWVVDVADRLGVPSILYWIQPAAVFAVYHHYFHGYRELIKSHADDPSFLLELPGLPPLETRDLPSFLVDVLEMDKATKEFVMCLFEETFEALDKLAEEGKPRVIVNTFGDLEPAVIEAMRDSVEIIPVGPVLPSESCRSAKDVVDLSGGDGEGCMEWLDKWPDGSVVYLSFGSISVLGRRQREEFARALVECRRPFLWVLRGEREGVEEAEGVETGKLVGWCNQVEVLGHKAVGCFVTHHGWNSTLEAMACGVPMVGLPQWSDQPTNTRLVEGLWGLGLRATVGGDGVAEGKELRRCLEAVMGDGEEGVEMRRRAAMWKKAAADTVREGGPSDRNLKALVESMGAT